MCCHRASNFSAPAAKAPIPACIHYLTARVETSTLNIGSTLDRVFVVFKALPQGIVDSSEKIVSMCTNRRPQKLLMILAAKTVYVFPVGTHQKSQRFSEVTSINQLHVRWLPTLQTFPLLPAQNNECSMKLLNLVLLRTTWKMGLLGSAMNFLTSVAICSLRECMLSPFVLCSVMRNVFVLSQFRFCLTRRICVHTSSPKTPRISTRLLRHAKHLCDRLHHFLIDVDDVMNLVMNRLLTRVVEWWICMARFESNAPTRNFACLQNNAFQTQVEHRKHVDACLYGMTLDPPRVSRHFSTPELSSLWNSYFLAVRARAYCWK